MMGTEAQDQAAAKAREARAQKMHAAEKVAAVLRRLIDVTAAPRAGGLTFDDRCVACVDKSPHGKRPCKCPCHEAREVARAIL